MANEVHVRGLADLQKFLDQLPPKMEKNVMRGALRAGMRTVLPVARANIHSVSGELARGLRIGTNARGGKVIARLVAKGKHAYLAKWVEYGTKAHAIAAKKVGLSFLGIFTKKVQHPGARPHAFMRPALDQQTTAAVTAAAEYMKRRLADKHGMDTADIQIGDES